MNHPRRLPSAVRLALGPVLLAAASFALAAPQLAVEESVELAAPPAAVWRLTGDFSGLPAWHPAVATTQISKGKDNTPGAVRVITTKDGAKIVETLRAWNGKGRSLTYAIDESPLPVAGYVSTFKVLPHGKGSRVVWSSNFERAGQGTDEEARQVIAGIYKAGFEGMQAKLGK